MPNAKKSPIPQANKIAKIEKDVKSIKRVEQRILGEGKYKTRVHENDREQDKLANQLYKLKVGAKTGEGRTSIVGSQRDAFSRMLVDPVNCIPIPSIDDFSGMVSIVKQKQVVDCAYVVGLDTRIHGGLLFTGGMRENIFRLKNDRWSYQHFTFANLYPDNAGMLAERSSNFNRQVGSSYIASMSRIVVVGSINVIPMRDGIYYPGNLGTASLTNSTYTVDSPCSLITGSNMLNTADGWTKLPAAGAGLDTIYPCLATDKITLFVQASANALATLSFDVNFYDSSGNLVTSAPVTSSALASTNVNTTLVLEITVPSGAVSWNYPILTSNIGNVIMYSLTLTFTPQTTAAYPAHPTSFWEAIPVPDYLSELSGVVNTWRTIAASVRWTDNTPAISANGLIAARVIESCSGPGDSVAAPYPTLATLQGAYNGSMITDKPGLYAFLKFNSINARTFRNANAPFEFNGPYVFALSQHNSTDVQLSRIEICTIFEITTASQLILRVKPHVDINGYALIMSMITEDLQVGDNPNHLKRLNKFINNFSRWTHQGLDTIDNAIDQARGVAARILAGK